MVLEIQPAKRRSGRGDIKTPPHQPLLQRNKHSNLYNPPKTFILNT